jgi:hypothetical protein
MFLIAFYHKVFFFWIIEYLRKDGTIGVKIGAQKIGWKLDVLFDCIGEFDILYIYIFCIIFQLQYLSKKNSMLQNNNNNNNFNNQNNKNSINCYYYV